MQNVIITGGNKGYFPYLEVFIKSVRKFDKATRIIVCDNTIRGRWDKPGTYKNGGSFSIDQLRFFKEKNVEVVLFSELISKAKLSRAIFDSVLTGHWAYPAKYIYCYLISRSLGNETRKIAFFDADIFFQDDVSLIFDKMVAEKLYINHEHSLINDSNYMKKWVSFSKERVASAELDLIHVQDCLNFCTGFFGAKKDVFLEITNLAVLLSTNKVLPFHSDQTLMNILIHTYKLPYEQLGNLLIHLAHIKKENIAFIDRHQEFLIKEEKPVAIHYHGKHRELIKSKLFDHYKPQELSLSDKVKHKIVQLLK